MGYSESMEAAGAKVLAYEEFGSYQGDWAAMVEYEGHSGIVFGCFGSCSGCDAFCAEFDFDGGAPSERSNGTYYSASYEDITKEQYDEQMADYKRRLADFGRDYLRNFADKNIIETQLSNLKPDDYFDEERKEMLEWCLKQFPKT